MLLRTTIVMSNRSHYFCGINSRGPGFPAAQKLQSGLHFHLDVHSFYLGACINRTCISEQHLVLYVHSPFLNVGHCCDTLVLLRWLGASEHGTPSGTQRVGRPFVPVCHLLLSVGSEEPQRFSKDAEYVCISFPFFSPTACH